MGLNIRIAEMASALRIDTHKNIIINGNYFEQMATYLSIAIKYSLSVIVWCFEVRSIVVSIGNESKSIKLIIFTMNLRNETINMGHISRLKTNL